MRILKSFMAYYNFLVWKRKNFKASLVIYYNAKKAFRKKMLCFGRDILFRQKILVRHSMLFSFVLLSPNLNDVSKSILFEFITKMNLISGFFKKLSEMVFKVKFI